MCFEWLYLPVDSLNWYTTCVNYLMFSTTFLVNIFVDVTVIITAGNIWFLYIIPPNNQSMERTVLKASQPFRCHGGAICKGDQGG